MVNLAVESVQRRGWKRCGVLGMGDPTVYTERLSALGVQCETLPARTRERLDRAIIAVMEGRANKASASVTSEAVYQLFRRGVDGVVLGCTELPLLLGAAAEVSTLVNPAQLVAEAALRRAIES
jgi:aspartate racemase